LINYCGKLVFTAMKWKKLASCFASPLTFNNLAMAVSPKSNTLSPLSSRIQPRKIRVLTIMTNLAVGGVQDNVLMTLERLNRKKYEVSLITSSEGEWLPRVKGIKDLNLIFMDSFTRVIHPLKDLATLFKIHSKIKKDGYDIVHTHSSKAGVLGRLAAKLAGVQIIVHSHHGLNFHDYLNPATRFIFLKLERFLSRISSRLITVSQLNLQKVLDAKLAPRNKFANIYYGIDFEKFDVRIDISAKRKEIGVVGNEKIVATVGRLFPQKAPQDLIRAMPKVLAAHRDVAFVFIGGGEMLPQLQLLAKKLGVESQIRFLGDRDDVPELLQIVDVFILTSLWEGMPRALIEAMYCARPLVATAVDGTPELVQQNETGILVPPRDIDAIANGIITLLNDEKKAKQMGAEAKRRVSEKFAIDKMISEIERVYDELLEQKGLIHPSNSQSSA
jgi:glycosyltransferase involved in cell wall biosynthesis